MRPLAIGLLVLAAAIAWPQFLIVPEGEQAGSVTPKALKAEMNAYGAYATARLELTFATDPNWSSEVDFMMRLPENTEATGFAYWFGDEYVVAKTVEKARAAQIYEFITSRRRDPALVEMVGRRQFRVRIAPIDPEKDLRVEIKLVLTPTKGALALPLAALFSRPLESVDLTLTAPVGWEENWGRPGEQTGGRVRYRFESKPWSPRSDWRVAPPRKPVAVSVGRPTEGEGTILAAYTATRDLTNVRLSAPPGALSHVYPEKVARLMTGETVTFAARITGRAPRQATLAIGGTRWVQPLPREPFADRSAVVVWGARHVAALKDPAQIRRWGLWLGIPTRETSWLAVPTAELEALKEARVAVAMREYWLYAAKYGKNSFLARKALEQSRILMRDRFPHLGAEFERHFQGRLNRIRWDALDLLGSQYASAVAAYGGGSAKAKEFAAGYRRIADRREDERESLDSMLSEAIESRVDDYVGFDLEEPLSDAKACPVRAQISRLLEALSPATRKETYPYGLQRGLEAAEGLRLGLAVENTPENRLAARRAVELAPLFGSPAQLRARARASLAAGDLSALAESWFYRNGKLETPPPLAERLKQLDERLARFGLEPKAAMRQLEDIVTISAMSPQPRVDDPEQRLLTEDQERFIAHYHMDRARILHRMYGQEYRWAWSTRYGLEVATRRNPADLDKAITRLEGWARVLGKPVPAPGTAPPGYAWQRSRDEFVIALRQHGPDHPITQAARRRMEADDRGRPGRVRYRADVLRTEIEIDELSWRKLTQEEEARRAELEKRRDELFARMGDPLLVVQAPKDARVAALLPDGRLVSLTWNGQSLRWEHRFDLPPGAREETVVIPVWIVRATGTTEHREVRIHVDQTSPKMEVMWTPTPTGWRVEAVTEAGVARVNVALADGRRLALRRIGENGGRVTWQAEIAGPIVGEAIIVATDAAHNRTEVRKSFSPLP